MHHGDGVQAIFYDDPRVMTVSLHETPACLFPGTGFPTETGGPRRGGHRGQRRAAAGHHRRRLAAGVPRRRARTCCAPTGRTVLVTQHGCDSHRHDPLADLDLSLDGQRASYLALAALADELCEGRWVSTGGGGYALLDVVPRAWTHLLGIVSGEPVDPDTVIPEAWRDEIGEWAPRTMTDGGRHRPTCRSSTGITPESRVDQAILATRRAVFPELGLDPEL